jgi:hypothetical protein
VRAPVTREELAGRLASGGVGYRVLESGGGWALVAPSLGARVLGAGAGAENAFWTACAFGASAGASAPGAGWNAGGQRTWLAPEAGPGGFFLRPDGAWVVPPALDPGAYRETDVPGWPCSYRNELSLSRQDGESFALEITRSVAAGPPAAAGGIRIRLRHELTNRGENAIPGAIGLWSIIQLPAERRGSTLIPVRRGPGAAFRPYFTEVPSGSVREGHGVVALESLGGRKYKMGVSAERAEFAPGRGLIAHVRPARRNRGWILVCMSFPVEAGGPYVDKPSYEGAGAESSGDAIQAYNSPETGEEAFAEIECHAPSRRLAPGQAQAFEIDVTIAECSDAALPELLRREVSPLYAQEILFRE